ncbi:hypothetical protein DH86_00000378 [Scytalidium sp. 3C]|nr:hypothetical protein DH86_00000378 [Scytalidium sp. 3C]
MTRRFRDIFEATTGRSLKISNSENEQKILLGLATRFEDISFRTPILSVYELRESKTNSTPLLHQYLQLVNRESCATHAPEEEIVGLNLNHNDTCLFTKSVGGEGLTKLNNFVYKTFHDAVHLVASRFEDCRLRKCWKIAE